MKKNESKTLKKSVFCYRFFEINRTVSEYQNRISSRFKIRSSRLASTRNKAQMRQTKFQYNAIAIVYQKGTTENLIMRF